MTRNLLFLSSWTFETLRLGWNCLNSLISLITELNLGSTSLRIIGTLFLLVEGLLMMFFALLNSVVTALTTTSHPPKVWERHVDNAFSIIQKTNLHYFFQHINSLHPKTKFTMETEENSQLPFLDTLMQRNSDNTISVRVYRNPTHTDQ